MRVLSKTQPLQSDCSGSLLKWRFFDSCVSGPKIADWCCLKATKFRNFITMGIMVAQLVHMQDWLVTLHCSYRLEKGTWKVVLPCLSLHGSGCTPTLAQWLMDVGTSDHCDLEWKKWVKDTWRIERRYNHAIMADAITKLYFSLLFLWIFQTHVSLSHAIIAVASRDKKKLWHAAGGWKKISKKVSNSKNH